MRLLAAVSALVLVALAQPGCARRETAVESGDREQVLHRSLGYEVGSLDPQLAAGIAEQDVASSLFEGLVAEDPRDLHPVPGVAERWDVSPDGLTYTFRLRADARWSDGAEVTAGDFVGSWRRMLTPSLGAEYAEMLDVLRGARAFRRGETRDFSSVGATALDPRTLRVNLDHPVPEFPRLLANPAWYPVPLGTIAANGPLWQRGNPWASPGRMVGNGPFVLESWIADKEIVVKRSPSYWDASAVRLHGIHFYPIDSVEAEERAFRSGQLHVTDAVPVDRIEAYRRDSPGLLRADPYLGTYFYRLNVRRPPLDDVRIRRALSLGVDRAAIVDRILHGEETEARAFTPAGIGDYVPPPGAGTNFDEARRLLAASGHPGGAGLPPLELLYNNSENHRAIAEAIQEMWRRELGIDVRLANQEQKVVLEERRTGAYQVVRSAWIADYASPESFLDIWRTGDGNNQTGWSDRRYDDLLDEASRAGDAASRDALWRQAEQRLLDGAPEIPIYHYSHLFLIRPSVRGWFPTVLDHHPYKHVWLDAGPPAR
jgi:oligopeptide transport system substrate-binding protein